MNCLGGLGPNRTWLSGPQAGMLGLSVMPLIKGGCREAHPSRKDQTRFLFWKGSRGWWMAAGPSVIMTLTFHHQRAGSKSDSQLREGRSHPPACPLAGTKKGPWRVSLAPERQDPLFSHQHGSVGLELQHVCLLG